MKYVFVVIFVGNIYFYVDIVTRYALTNGLFRIFSKIIKSPKFHEFLTSILTFLKSKITPAKAKELMLKFYHFIIFKFRKR